MNDRTKYLILANVMFAVYSATSIFTKLAAFENGITLKFVLYYGISLCLMGIYAIVWQQIIKKLPLTLAYSNKAVVLFWGLLWGVAFFGESVTFGKIMGIAIVVCGIILFASSDTGGSANG